MKLHEEFREYEELWETITEAPSKKLPTPPDTIEIVKIEPKLQTPLPYPGHEGYFRHYDEITYVDPYSNQTKKTTVWVDNPGFGKWFGWGSDYSHKWDYAAYTYEGNLLSGVDPTGHMSMAHKKAMERTVDEINNPAEDTFL